MNNVKMLYFDRINVSEGTDVNKTSKSKEYDFFSIGIFKTKGSGFNHMYATGVMIY